MGLTKGQALELVATLETELTLRGGLADWADRYYRGKHPLRFASEEFARYFATRYQGFSDNWVPIVADSPVERLTVQGFQPFGGESDPEGWRVWLMNSLDCDSQLGFLDAVKGARAFARVWGDPAAPDTPLVTFCGAAEAIVLYEPGSRYRRRAALRRWQDGYREFCCLYTAEQLWKFSRPLAHIEKTTAMAEADEQAGEWLPLEPRGEPNPQDNPMGLVPVVELANRPLLAGDPLSDVAPVIPLQDAVNMLWSLLFTASDYAAIAQRYIIGAEKPVVPVYDDSGHKVGEREVDITSPEFKLARMLFIEGENATAGSWPAAQLETYGNVIETAVGHIAAQTRTPQHYLIGKMANLSSDALIAAEAGLVKRTQEKQLWFGAALREIMRLVWLAKGDRGKADSYRAGSVVWKDSESRSQAQLVASLVQLKSIGWPFEDLARRFGLSPAEVTQLIEMREHEAQLDPMLAMLGTKELGTGGVIGRGGDPALLAEQGIPVPPENTRASADGSPAR